MLKKRGKKRRDACHEDTGDTRGRAERGHAAGRLE
jgi:hypothetical protein